MAFALTSPVTGGAQNGFTAPTYTVAVDTPPANNAKQWIVTVLGGTQVGVGTHTVSNPFTISQWKPLVPKTLSAVNPLTGVLPKVPSNVYKTVIRKGVTPLAGQPQSIATCTVILDIPAGADSADQPNVKALISAAIGSLNQQSAGLGDTVLNGSL